MFEGCIVQGSSSHDDRLAVASLQELTLAFVSLSCDLFELGSFCNEMLILSQCLLECCQLSRFLYEG